MINSNSHLFIEPWYILNFLQKFQNLSCIVSPQPLWGLSSMVPSQFFKPSRGIRQDDPLSPYIFILCIDMLSNYINYQEYIGLCTPIKLSTQGPHMSHLFYAETLLL